MTGGSENALPGFAVVVVHWGSFEHTLGCLEALSRVSYPNVRVFAVDNASQTFDERAANNALAALTIVSSGVNLGFAGGCNLGLAMASCSDARFFVLLNNDARVLPNIFEEMLKAFEDPTVGIAGPLVADLEDPTRIAFAGGRYSRILGASFRRKTLSDLGPVYGQVTGVDFVSGSACFIRREVWEQSGGLWEDLFLYYEETDLCLRSVAKGWRCVVLSKPLVQHQSAASVGLPDRAYYLARNAFHMIRRHHRGLQRLTAYMSQFLVMLPLWFVESAAKRRWALINDYLVGVIDGVRMRTGSRLTGSRRP